MLSPVEQAHILTSPPIPCQFPSTLCSPMAGKPLNIHFCLGPGPYSFSCRLCQHFCPPTAEEPLKIPFCYGPMLLTLHVSPILNLSCQSIFTKLPSMAVEPSNTC